MTSTNLPVQLTSFVGREREITEIQRLFADARLVTLTGTGGCGKTRLALHASNTISDRFKDGVWFVGLASLNDPMLVPQAINQTLSVPHLPEQSALDSLLNYVKSKELLLVLDNCEHLIGACAQLAQEILSHAQAVRILSTSREPLAIAGEVIYPVSGLARPSTDAEQVENPLDYLQYDAVRLFVERARAVMPNFTITNANAERIVQICRCLDGLPLALELASARSNVLTLQQIAERLEDRFTLLISLQRSEPDPRYRTLRGAIDWSYNLLSIPEQVLLRRLSVFTGGCSLESAETVCAGKRVERKQMLDLLSSLVNKSLLVAHTFLEGEARYHLLETIRQYAQEKLIASGEFSVVRDQHLQFFLKLAQETAPKLTGPYQQLWLNRVKGEYENLRAALAWSLEGSRIEAGLRMGIALYQFWVIRDYVQEGLMWLERLLARSDGGNDLVVRANGLAYAAFLAGIRGNTPAQMEYGRKAAFLAEAAGNEGKPALAWALAAQSFGARAAGDYQSEFALGKREIQLFRELGDLYMLGVSLSTNSFAAMSLGKYDEAHAMLDEALPLLRQAGSPYRIAMALNFSGDLARCEQNYIQAQTAYEESISMLRELDAVRDLASALHNLGHTCLHLGDAERALALFRESMAIQLAKQNIPGVAECLIGFAAMSVVYDLPAAGARLLAAAVTIGGQRIASAWAATRMEYEHVLAIVRTSLTETEFQSEQAAGRAFSLEQAVAYAQNLPLQSKTQGINKKLDVLTMREREVTELIAHGKTNAEIAQELVVSKRTVEKHIAHILSKLGVRNRAQIVRWAIETGLTKPNE